MILSYKNIYKNKGSKNTKPDFWGISEKGSESCEFFFMVTK